MKSFRKFLTLAPLLACLVFASALSSAQTPHAVRNLLPQASPSAAVVTRLGFSPERLAKMDQFYQAEVDRGDIAGIVILITRHGKLVHRSAIGYADLENRRPMAPDTIFRLYSMTKPIAATALMMLYQEGRFQMQDPLSKYLPEFADLRVLRTPESELSDTVPMERPPTMQDVLRHTAGFSHGLGPSALDAEYVKANVFGLDVSLEQMMSKLAKLPLMNQPGTTFTYSVGPDVQGRLVEVLSGMPFDVFLEKRLFAPLGMKDAGFWLDAGKAKRLATVHWSKDGKLTPLDEAHGHPEGGVLVQPWSVNSYTVNNKRKGGSFGLVATAEDYWRFGQMMLNRGELDGVRVLSPAVAQYMVRDQMGPIAKAKPDSPAWGLGFTLLKDPVTAGYMGHEGTFSHGGAAATYCWVDPKEQLVVVAMTQHLGAPSVGNLTAQMHTLVYSALLE